MTDLFYFIVFLYVYLICMCVIWGASNDHKSRPVLFPTGNKFYYYYYFHIMYITTRIRHLFILYMYILPKPRTDTLKFSYVYRVVKCWNSLPAAVCDAQSVSIFKSRLSDYMNLYFVYN